MTIIVRYERPASWGRTNAWVIRHGTAKHWFARFATARSAACYLNGNQLPRLSDFRYAHMFPDRIVVLWVGDGFAIFRGGHVWSGRQWSRLWGRNNVSIYPTHAAAMTAATHVATRIANASQVANGLR